jgi:hypothetical protein
LLLEEKKKCWGEQSEGEPGDEKSTQHAHVILLPQKSMFKSLFAAQFAGCVPDERV